MALNWQRSGKHSSSLLMQQYILKQCFRQQIAFPIGLDAQNPSSRAWWGPDFLFAVSSWRQGRLRVRGRSLVSIDAQSPAHSGKLGVTPDTHLWDRASRCPRQEGKMLISNARTKMLQYWRCGPTPRPLTEVTQCFGVCFHRLQTSIHCTYFRTNTISIWLLESQKEVMPMAPEHTNVADFCL